jgi:hypothetical protein
MKRYLRASPIILVLLGIFWIIPAALAQDSAVEPTAETTAAAEAVEGESGIGTGEGVEGDAEAVSGVPDDAQDNSADGLALLMLLVGVGAVMAVGFLSLVRDRVQRPSGEQ